MKTALKILLATLILLSALESGLRLAGYPHGDFAFALRGPHGAPHPPETRIRMLWGPIPFDVHTTATGHRQIGTQAAPDGAPQLGLLGDSFTYGFFCDDADTFPARLAALWADTPPAPAQLLNLGNPGASIEDLTRQYLLYVARYPPPAFTVLAISANDVKDTVLPYRPIMIHPATPSASGDAGWSPLQGLSWVLSHSALLEQSFSLVLQWQKPDFLAAQRKLEAGQRADRYQIPGMADQAANLGIYQAQLWEEWQSTEGPWDNRLQEKTAAYRRYLADLTRHIRAAGSIPLAVYIPSYYQVHHPTYTGALNQALAGMTAELGIPFLDTTGALRQHARESLFLLPADLHMSPQGNQRLAEALSPFLLEQLQAASRPAPAPSAQR